MNQKLIAALQAINMRTWNTDCQIGEAFPYFSKPETGTWETTPDGNWCAGHWICLLLLAAKNEQDENRKKRLVTSARQHTEVFFKSFEKMEKSLFAGMNCYYIGFLAADLSNDKDFFSLGFEGADVIKNLYNPLARQIPSGEFLLKGPGPAHATDKQQTRFETLVKGWMTAGYAASAVDSAYVSLPVLWRAYRESQKHIYFDIALQHLNVYMDRFIRDDGSTRQKVGFSLKTGEPTEEFFDLAKNNNGCWARGFGWCMAGLCLAYNATGNDLVLKKIMLCMNFYKKNVLDDMVPYWDITLENRTNEPKDTSAAALVAYGLVQLQGSSESILSLRSLGERILLSLTDRYMVNEKSDQRHGMITDGCYNRSSGYAIKNELIWTNFYVAYALEHLINHPIEKQSQYHE